MPEWNMINNYTHIDIYQHVTYIYTYPHIRMLSYDIQVIFGTCMQIRPSAPITLQSWPLTVALADSLQETTPAMSPRVVWSDA